MRLSSAQALYPSARRKRHASLAPLRLLFPTANAALVFRGGPDFCKLRIPRRGDPRLPSCKANGTEVALRPAQLMPRIQFSAHTPAFRYPAKLTHSR